MDGTELIPISPSGFQVVHVAMTVEKLSRKWAADAGLCLVDWQTIADLADCYKDHGAKTVVFDVSKTTYVLRDKAAA